MILLCIIPKESTLSMVIFDVHLKNHYMKNKIELRKNVINLILLLNKK